MTLRRKAFDNGVRYVPKSEQTREIKQNTIKNNSPPRNQKNIFHKTIKSSTKMLQHKDSNTLLNIICTSIRIIILLFISEHM